MASIRRLALGLAAMAAVMVLTLPSASEAGMQRFQWQNRPLLVFAPAGDDPALERQLKIAAEHRAGWRERDMVTILVVGDRPVTVDGTRAKDLDKEMLRQRYRVTGNSFVAILVGKDGTEKLRRDEAIAAAKLFQTIDAMPMRRREMREQNPES